MKNTKLKEAQKYEKLSARREINRLAAAGQAFMFVISYDLSEIYIIQKSDLFLHEIYFSTPIWEHDPLGSSEQSISLNIETTNKQGYEENLRKLILDIQNGESYLTNFTTSTLVSCHQSLLEIFQASKALFRLYFAGEFISFSPERFVQIQDNKISTYPMKGTIVAKNKEIASSIMDDKKESYEHNTIIDLMRNDLSMHASQVRLDQYRYLSEIRSPAKRIFQVSSSITGELEQNWKSRLGDIIMDMLPAGSISGAPKKRTCELIAQYESHQRNFYTGIAGFFDGQSFDSAVLIRYMEPSTDKNTYIYKSGGGITALSTIENEYQECIDKIYVPTF